MNLTLKDKHSIKHLFRNGKKYSGATIYMIICKSNIQTDTKFLFTVSKTIKTKPNRNVLKRRMREIIYAIYPNIKRNYYIAIIGNNKDIPFQALKEEITYILQSARLQ